MGKDDLRDELQSVIGDSKAIVDLDVPDLLCSRHAAVYRETWPSGYPLTIPMMFDALAQDKAWAAELDAGEGDVAATVKKALQRIPACCRLGPDRMLCIWQEIHKLVPTFGRVAFCRVCGRCSLGSSVEGQNVSFTHVCWRCLLYRMHTTDPNVH